MFNFVKNIFGTKDPEQEEIEAVINSKKKDNSKFDIGFGLVHEK
jgi:hypothetical protein